MNKVKLKDIELKNNAAIASYLNNQVAYLNEYYYIQEKDIIINLLKRIENNSEVDNANFLTGFFWNQQKSNYQLGENCGKFFLRLSGYQDNNILIETKTLTLEEKINFLDNINYIVEINSKLRDMFDLENFSFLEKMVELGRDKDFFEIIKVQYCNDWIEEQTFKNIIQEGIKIIESVELKRKLENTTFSGIKVKKIKI